jgi:hypothetical protein
LSLPFKEVHIRRWQIGAAFAVLTVIFVLGLVKVQHDAASIHDLQRTNCGLRNFLLTARNARLRAAAEETDGPRQSDLRAAEGYLSLASAFQGKAVGECPPPPSPPAIR